MEGGREGIRTRRAGEKRKMRGKREERNERERGEREGGERERKN